MGQLLEGERVSLPPTGRPTDQFKADGAVGAYEAKTHLAALLDRVEKGETPTVTRNGRPVARLAPAGPPRPMPDAKALPWSSTSANSGKR